MKIATEALVQDLIKRTNEIILQAEAFRELPEATLNFKKDPDSWSVLECLEHLNRYGRFYLPEITKRIAEGKGKSEPAFKSGWLGNYFANSMLPKENLNKMKTFQNMNPLNSKLDKTVIDEFLEQQNELMRLLGSSRAISLNKTRTGISISKWIRLKLGDTFRFVIYHNQRHVAQALRIKN